VVFNNQATLHTYLGGKLLRGSMWH